MKMYIAILDEFPDYMTPTLVGHAVLRHHLEHDQETVYQDWLKNSFKKCVVRVNQKEFDKILKLENITISQENNTLNGIPSCVTIVIKDNTPNVLKFAKLWKPKENDES